MIDRRDAARERQEILHTYRGVAGLGARNVQGIGGQAQKLKHSGNRTGVGAVVCLYWAAGLKYVRGSEQVDFSDFMRWRGDEAGLAAARGNDDADADAEMWWTRGEETVAGV